jgi:hypothetical protein
MQLLSRSFFVLFIILVLNLKSYTQPYQVLESGVDHITINFNFGNSYTVVDTLSDGRLYQKIRGENHTYRNPGDPWLPEYIVLAGIPFNSQPTIKILNKKQSLKQNQFIIPYPVENPALVKQDFDKIDKYVYSKNDFFPISPVDISGTYVVRYANILQIKIAPYQFNPVTRELIYNHDLTIRVDFNSIGLQNIEQVNDPMTIDFLKSSVINFNAAKDFVGKVSSKSNSPTSNNSNWYNPNKNYFKLYLKQKGVYRITYEELIAAGAQLGSNTPINKLELFNDGLAIPIEVFDINSDQLFNSGDYLQFVGYPPTPTPYCSSNIYNLSNLYWFSYESDSTGVNYVNTPGYPDIYDRSYFRNLTTIHFEKDTLYERLGYAPPNEDRDYWFWDKATSRDGAADYEFVQYFDAFPLWYSDSTSVRLKVALQGMTRSSCQYDHNAYIYVNDSLVGNISWDAQKNAVFDKVFTAGPNGIPIYPGNLLKVRVTGDSCRIQNYND